MTTGNYCAEKNIECDVRNKLFLISFICSIMIIYIHTYNLTKYGIDENATGFPYSIFRFETTWNHFGYTALSVIFFISGFLFYRTYDLTITKDKYISRIKSILIPYLLWCTIYYLLFVLLTNLPFIGSMLNTDRLSLSLTEWIHSLWLDEYYTLWFLKELIVYIALCPIIYILLKNRFIGALILTISFIFPEIKSDIIPLSGYLYYLTGTYLAINCHDLIYLKNRLASVISCLFLIIMFITQFRYSLHPLARLGIIVAFWFIADLFPLNRDYPWWMKITFFTYVAHDIYLELIEKILILTLGTAPIYALLDYLLVPIIVFFLLVLTARILREHVPIIWSICTGMRE